MTGNVFNIHCHRLHTLSPSVAGRPHSYPPPRDRASPGPDLTWNKRVGKCAGGRDCGDQPGPESGAGEGAEGEAAVGLGSGRKTTALSQAQSGQGHWAEVQEHTLSGCHTCPQKQASRDSGHGQRCHPNGRGSNLTLPRKHPQ